ncbi:MAG: transcriptional regulator [Alphaproteobacteria bacterium]|nr:transcriptional regulator [Alphaproteobacteria bacterium]
MAGADFKLVVILSEPELADRLVAEIQALGARGFSRYDGYSEWRRGRGPDDAPGPHDWQGTHTRIETVVRGEVAHAILERLAKAYFEHYAVFAYVVDATIARRERYV